MSKFIIISIVFIGALASLSYGPIMRTTGSSNINEDIGDMRQIITSIFSYYASNQRHPENLQELIDQGFMDNTEDIELWKLQIYYIKNRDINEGRRIILFTSMYDHQQDEENQGVVAYVDGSVERIKRHELDNLLAQEIVKLRAQLSANRL